MATAILLATATAAQAEEVEESLVWIEAGNKEIPALLTTKDNEGAILLLHDIDSSVVDKAFIEPIRKLLPEKGWDVLAIRLPATRPGAGTEAYSKLLQEQLQRLQAAIKMLNDTGYKSIVLAGHGFGAFTALQAAEQAGKQEKENKEGKENNKDENEENEGGKDEGGEENEEKKEPEFKAAILVNIMWYNYPKGRDRVIFGIEDSAVPVLDISAAQAHPQVVQNNNVRKAATGVASSRQKNLYSRHIPIPLTRHDMAGSEEIIVRIISNWLNGQLELPH